MNTEDDGVIRDGESKRAQVFIESMFSDGLENLMASLGTGNDKRQYSHFQNNKRLSSNNPVEINSMYRTNWIAGKVVDIIPNDMTSNWRRFTNPDPKIVEALEAEERRLGVQAGFNMAHKWGRLYGTCGLIIAATDDEAYAPIDIDSFKPGHLRHIKPLDRTMLHQSMETAITLDPMNENFGLPEFYSIHQTNTKVHNSRVLRFDGVRLPQTELANAGYMNDSVLDRLYDSIINFSTAADGGASMIYNMNVDIVSIEGLMQMLQTPTGEALIKKRFAMVSLMKSFNNLVVKDSKETWDSRSHSFAGLPDLLDKYSKILAGATEIPATRFLGSAPGGLNATGESDMRNYYDTLGAKQVNEYGPLLYRLDKLMAANIGLPSDADLTYEWNSLIELSEKEQAELELSRSTRDANYLANNVVDRFTVAKELRKRGTYGDMSDDLTGEDEDGGHSPEAELTETPISNTV